MSIYILGQVTLNLFQGLNSEVRHDAPSNDHKHDTSLYYLN